MSLFDQFENESTQPSQFAATARRQSTNPPAQPLIGYVSIRPQTQLLPIFSLDRVQFPFPFVNLVSLAVSSNILLLVAESGSNSSRKDGAGQRLYRIDLGKSDAIDEIEPGLRQRNDKIRRVFLDPTAKHLLFSTEMGDNYYLYHHWRKPRVLNKFRGVLIESVAWGKSGSAGGVPTTGVILVGSRQGHVFEAELQPTDEFFKREEKYFRQVYSIPENNTPINSIRFEQFPAVPNKYVVFLSSPSRLYQFIGNVTDIDSGSMFTDLFRKYDGPGNSFQEMPGESLRGELQFWCQFVQATGYPGVPKAFAWLTGSGLYCGDLVFGNQSGGDSIVNNAQLLPYPRSNESSRSNSSTDGPYAPGEVPISVNITEFHFLLLYENYFKAINNLTNQVDHEEQIPLEFGEYVVGLFVDPIKSTYWISTNLALYELIMTEEDRDVWRIYLDRKSFDTALSHAKTPAHKDIVITAQAEYYYSQKRYMLSATYYAQCASLSFEEIVLKFIDKDERGALHQYLLQKLGRLRPQDSTQITLISTWLVEIFINKLNILHDELRDASVLVDTLSKDVNVDEASEQAKSERKRLEEEEAVALDEFRQFLQKYKARLDLDTTSNIIASHGRVQELLYFLELMGNFEKVVTYWIQEQEWLKALGALARQPSSDLYYKFSPVLMDHAPYETVNSWIRQPNLNPRNLIPALLRYQVRDRNQGKQGVEGQNQAIRYLTYVTQKLQNTDTAVHNLLLSLYISQAKHNDDQELLQYLSSQRENPYYDQRYALRLCSQHGLPQACVVLYGAMGMHEQAVDLALQLHDLELAQINADKPEDDELLRRKLWLKIARHVVEEKRDIKQALAFLTQTADLLKIEDILPFFPDFVLIDDFKEEICVALENYNEHIEELKAEMDEATKSAESIRLDIRDLRNRYTAIPVTEECNICNAALLTRQFYVYPCEHVFHADCLTDQTIKNSNPTKAKRVKDLQRRITQGVAARRAGPATDEGGINLASAMLAMRLGKPYEAAIEPAAVKTEVLKEELDDLIAAECPLCGDLMIKSVDRPFVDATEMELIRSWEL
ncbi:vacuolar protein sorting protein 18 [Fimicolochytrium jonesii]|uniref:vacuolar protein sorting protein 18 n=1 Tax=Fimicolochytrium jonesii TaxID=1396493 RepID=UPI0022FE42E9|nr:vacuolar protein sorting protein 18 [Fimicolochytrium jonesii]KAI8823436.1 vacuolar protein sorting protein 18 [Fimicolochytrium jonesii]